MLTKSHLIVAVVTALALLPVGSPALAKGAKDRGVRVQGRCTGSSTAKLKLANEEGRIAVEFEVDQNRNGVAWNVAIRRNGTVVATGVRITRPPSGSFTFRRVLSNGAGADVVKASARRGSGEVCTATATWRG